MTAQTEIELARKKGARELQEKKAPSPYELPEMIDLLWRFGTGE